MPQIISMMYFAIFTSLDYGIHSKHTFVDTVFGGHLISSVKCNECLNVSSTSIKGVVTLYLDFGEHFFKN